MTTDLYDEEEKMRIFFSGRQPPIEILEITYEKN